MEFVVEIGNENEKKLIEGELAILGQMVEQIYPAVNLKQFIVPADFESKINQMEKRDTYRAMRGMDSGNITAMARLADVDDGFAIVLSPLLYTTLHDGQTRFYIVMHELSHIINKSQLHPVITVDRANEVYLGNLYYLYDEYSSDRFALGMGTFMFPNTSSCWDQFASVVRSGYLQIANDSRYYDLIRSEIESFRKHTDVDLFHEKILSSISDIAVCISHLFAWLHMDPDRFSDSDFSNSPFINQRR